MRVVAGALAAVLGLVLAAAGAVVGFWVVGSDGVRSNQTELSTKGAAIATTPETITFSGELRVTAEAADSAPVFIGVAHHAHVQNFLADAAYLRVTELDTSASITGEEVSGKQTALATAEDRGWWETSVSGEGSQTLELEVPDGPYDLVIMHADGSEALSVDTSFGVAYPGVYQASLVALGVGAVLMVGGVLFLVLGRGSREAIDDEPVWEGQAAWGGGIWGEDPRADPMRQPGPVGQTAVPSPSASPPPRPPQPGMPGPYGQPGADRPHPGQPHPGQPHPGQPWPAPPWPNQSQPGVGQPGQGQMGATGGLGVPAGAVGFGPPPGEPGDQSQFNPPGQPGYPGHPAHPAATGQEPSSQYDSHGQGVSNPAVPEASDAALFASAADGPSLMDAPDLSENLTAPGDFGTTEPPKLDAFRSNDDQFGPDLMDEGGFPTRPGTGFDPVANPGPNPGPGSDLGNLDPQLVGPPGPFGGSSRDAHGSNDLEWNDSDFADLDGAAGSAGPDTPWAERANQSDTSGPNDIGSSSGPSEAGYTLPPAQPTQQSPAMPYPHAPNPPPPQQRYGEQQYGPLASPPNPPPFPAPSPFGEPTLPPLGPPPTPPTQPSPGGPHLEPASDEPPTWQPPPGPAQPMPYPQDRLPPSDSERDREPGHGLRAEPWTVQPPGPPTDGPADRSAEPSLEPPSRAVDPRTERHEEPDAGGARRAEPTTQQPGEPVDDPTGELPPSPQESAEPPSRTGGSTRSPGETTFYTFAPPSNSAPGDLGPPVMRAEDLLAQSDQVSQDPAAFAPPPPFLQDSEFGSAGGQPPVSETELSDADLVGHFDERPPWLPPIDGSGRSGGGRD